MSLLHESSECRIDEFSPITMSCEIFQITFSLYFVQRMRNHSITCRWTLFGTHMQHAQCTRRPLESKYNNKAIFSSYMTNNDNARIRTHAITHTVFITCSSSSSSNSESPVLSARASHTRQKSATIDSKIWTDNNVRSNFICHRQRRLNDDAAAAVAR